MISETGDDRFLEIVARPPGLLGAAIWSQLIVRLASSSGLMVLGAYFVDLHDHGMRVGPLVVGLVVTLTYVTEILAVPVAGALSDRHGRVIFLIGGPLVSAVAVLLIPLGALSPLHMVGSGLIVLVGVSRLVEGVGAGASVPTTLAVLADGTDGAPRRRGRLMSFFELASSSGLAIGVVVGPLLWVALHLLAFVALAALYVTASVIASRLRPLTWQTVPGRHGMAPQWYRTIIARRDLGFFLPAWIAMNAILGVWATAQLTFVLTARLQVPHQRVVGGLHGHPAELSLLLGAYVLWFSICVAVWSLIVGTLPRLRVLQVTATGSLLASIGLIVLNHGGPLLVVLPLVLIGVFLEAGFAPAALSYLADASETVVNDRGRLLGFYSVILGLGQLIGSGLGGIAAQIAYFDGLAAVTVLLGLLALASLTLLRRMSPLAGCGSG